MHTYWAAEICVFRWEGEVQVTKYLSTQEGLSPRQSGEKNRGYVHAQGREVRGWRSTVQEWGGLRVQNAAAADLTFIFREWICMILARASSLGIGNSILRSRRPERSRAGSRMSTLLVAAITYKRGEAAT